MKSNIKNSLIGKKFRYTKGYNDINIYDRVIVKTYEDKINNTISVLSESGVTYGLSEIEIEPIALLRDEKLEKLGL